MVSPPASTREKRRARDDDRDHRAWRHGRDARLSVDRPRARRSDLPRVRHAPGPAPGTGPRCSHRDRRAACARRPGCRHRLDLHSDADARRPGDPVPSRGQERAAREADRADDGGCARHPAGGIRERPYPHGGPRRAILRGLSAGTARGGVGRARTGVLGTRAPHHRRPRRGALVARRGAVRGRGRGRRHP